FSIFAIFMPVPSRWCCSFYVPGDVTPSPGGLLEEASGGAGARRRERTDERPLARRRAGGDLARLHAAPACGPASRQGSTTQREAGYWVFRSSAGAGSPISAATATGSRASVVGFPITRSTPVGR